MDLQQALEKYIKFSRNSEVCFDVAVQYKQLNQSSAAIMFFLKSAELATESEQQYEALLQIALLLHDLTGRANLVKNVLQRAIAVAPKRSEAYFILATVQESLSQWQDLYTTCQIALETTQPGTLKVPLIWPGKDVFIFQKAVAAWWVDRPAESIALLRTVGTLNLPEQYKDLAKSNIQTLAPLLRAVDNRYIQEFNHLLKVRFPGCEHIVRNYSEVYQDLFVLMCTDGKTEGTFVEIGAAHSEYHSNTFLLEKDYKWSGISIDKNPDVFLEWNSRTAITYSQDARTINWETILRNSHYDYLQIDCDPPAVSLEVLYSLPLSRVSFSVITFEHDRYADKDTIVRDKSREYLLAHGYTLIIPNVSPDGTRPYEDWWVHEDCVNPKAISILCKPDREVNDVRECILNF